MCLFKTPQTGTNTGSLPQFSKIIRKKIGRELVKTRRGQDYSMSADHYHVVQTDWLALAAIFAEVPLEGQNPPLMDRILP